LYNPKNHLCGAAAMPPYSILPASEISFKKRAAIQSSKPSVIQIKQSACQHGRSLIEHFIYLGDGAYDVHLARFSAPKSLVKSEDKVGIG
jgi:hypothetical protein